MLLINLNVRYKKNPKLQNFFDDLLKKNECLLGVFSTHNNKLTI